LTQGKGPLTASGTGIGGFFHSSINRDVLQRPDIQFHTLPALANLDFDLAFRKMANVADAPYYNLLDKYKDM
jgi:hypothetical protein